MARKSSGPTGEAAVRAVRREAEKGWPPGLTVLTGEDVFHLDAAQRALLDHLAPGASSDFALTTLSEGKTSPGQLVAAARSIPMFESRRVVFVRDVGILEGDPDPLVDYAASPPDHSWVVVRAPKVDRRRPLHKALVKAGRTLEFPLGEAGGADVRREVGELADQRGLRLDRAVRAFLAEVCQGDLYRVSSELDKLDVWIGPGEGVRDVRVEDAREVVFGGAGLTTWEAADAIFERDLGSALGAVRRLLRGGEEPLKVLGGLAWRMRTLVHGKALAERGVPAEGVVRAARAWYYKGPFLTGLSRYSMDELLTFPSRLLAADRSLKSRSIDASSVMEALVRDLIDPPPAPREGT